MDAGKPEHDGEDQHHKCAREKAHRQLNRILKRCPQAVFIAGKQREGVERDREHDQRDGGNPGAKLRHIGQRRQIVKIKDHCSGQKQQPQERGVFEVCLEGAEIVPHKLPVLIAHKADAGVV